jgi:hypothetical protein
MSNNQHPRGPSGRRSGNAKQVKQVRRGPGSLALFDILVAAIGRRQADLVWKRGHTHVVACITDPWKYQNEPASRPA